MSKVRKSTKKASKSTERNRRSVFVVLMAVMVMGTVLLGFRVFASEEPPVIKIPQPSSQVVTPTPLVADEDETGYSAGNPLVGIVAGHKGYDPGAVCDDGLTEAEVNYSVAVEVVDLLQRRGITADLLDEYDDRLTDYRASALVSVHADSCNIPGATGFKVASVTNSAIPDAEDALVACINKEYAVYTNLPPHAASITDNMTNYHAFNEIHPQTPGAIIETGFLLDDRYVLESRPKVVARGIAAGILCFLENQ